MCRCSNTFISFAYYLFTLPMIFAGTDCTIKSEQNFTFSKEWNGYYSVHHANNWDVARFICESKQASMATPYTVRQTKSLQKIIKYFGMSCGVYIGARRTSLKAQYFTLEGVPICQIPHRFADNKPDLDVPETCLVMSSNGNLFDGLCTEFLPFLCFRKPRPCNTCYNLCKTSDPGYKFEQRTASCYKFHTNATTWGSAVQICANERGHLAIINSEVESRVLKEIFARFPSDKIYGATHSHFALVGFHDLFKKNCWRNIDGMSLRGSGFSTWAPGQPNIEAKAQDCGSVYRNGLLNDVNCAHKAAFICEIDTVPEGI